MTAHLLHLLTLVSAAHFALRRNEMPPADFPDGIRYLRAGAGERLHRPFHLRWLLPWLLGDDRRAWRMTTGAATIALAPLAYLFLLTCGLDATRALIGAMLVPGLPGAFRIGVVGAYLVDSVAMALVLIAATLFRTDHIAAALVVTLVASAVKESAFVFIACIAASPVALVGIVPVILRHVMSPPNPDDIFDARSRDMLERPIHWAREIHRGTWGDARVMLLPWGAAMIGLCLIREPWVAVTLAVAYAQTLVATDSVRLYQYAFPAMIYGAAVMLPVEWAPVIIAAHWLNPYQREMV